MLSASLLEMTEAGSNEVDSVRRTSLRLHSEERVKTLNPAPRNDLAPNQSRRQDREAGPNNL